MLARSLLSPLPLYHTTLADELFSSAGIKLVVSMYVPVQSNRNDASYSSTHQSIYLLHKTPPSRSFCTSMRLGGVPPKNFDTYCIIVGGTPIVMLFYNMIFSTVQAVKHFMTLSGEVTCRCHDDVTCGIKKIVNSTLGVASISRLFIPDFVL